MKYRLVFFDVDSTLVTIEGIDVLGAHNPEIARLTDAAMNGETALDEVYGRRLDLIQPTEAAVDALAARYLDSLATGAAETIAALQNAGAAVQRLAARPQRAGLPQPATLELAPRHL